ncbi:PEP-CTERM sorting domain-containing protein [Rhodopirellula sp. MGV]|uniref:PEP-CTERM sorting domain-containing protein n=1 Tax=Rhodopirellula sp. MGV TaxID=2023130 RepID=UPI000B975F5E|nr:PEP-CTERM sorting domain-containing protein [Rhodopirellula sp. MGV]OYP33000.1 hypothetical protein CGZ80_19115 [Rhodopirellula sp. MGV]PNY35340.1 PEP-CTERM sorting domain-containing protein [Rhodopirellula baltica]
MKKLQFAAFMALVCLQIQSASATVLGSLLTFDGVEDSLVDDSRSSFFDNDGNGVISVGDVVYGFAAMSEAGPTNSETSITDQVVAVFAVQVTGTDLTGTLLNGGVTTPGQDLGSLLTGTGFAPIDNGLGDAAFVILSHAGLTPEPLSFSSISDFTSADWEYEATLGFATGSNDYLHVDATFQPDGGGGFVLASATERGGFTVLDSVFTGAKFLPVSNLRLDETGFSSHEVVLDNAIIQDAGPTSPWDFIDQARFRLNAVPEPASALAFAGIMGLAGFSRRRRK